MPEKITYREIAERAAVSRTTVSLALRDHPSITAETRERVQSVARELGYRPNPFIAALMSSISGGRKKRITASLGLISLHSCNTRSRLHPGAAKELAMASAHAETLGYSLAEFALHDLETNHRSLQNVLLARGITGVILQDTGGFAEHLNGIDWNLFSVVRTGTRQTNLPFHTVVADHFQIVDDLINVLFSRNYQRIGLLLPACMRIVSAGMYEAAFRFRQAQKHGERLVSIFMPEKEIQAEDFGLWLSQNELDAVISPDHRAYIWLGQLNDKGSPLIAVAHTDAIDQWWPIAGMDQQRDLQTRTAIDLLALECSHNRRGFPDSPLCLLVPARWREGETVTPPTTPKSIS